MAPRHVRPCISKCHAAATVVDDEQEARKMRVKKPAISAIARGKRAMQPHDTPTVMLTATYMVPFQDA